jgi:hypothetical protein
MDKAKCGNGLIQQGVITAAFHPPDLTQHG